MTPLCVEIEGVVPKFIGKSSYVGLHRVILKMDYGINNQYTLFHPKTLPFSFQRLHMSKLHCPAFQFLFFAQATILQALLNARELSIKTKKPSAIMPKAFS